MVRVDSIQTMGQAAVGGQDDVLKAWTAPLLASSIPTLVLTRDGAVLEANAALAEFFAGAAVTEVGSLLDQDSAADLKRGLDALAGGGELALALNLSARVGDGLPLPLRADLLALRDREGVLLCVVAQFRENPADVALRESEARFSEVVENISEFFWVATADFSRLLYASPAYEQISGLPIEGIYKNFSASLEIIHSEDLSLVTDLLSRSQSIKEPLELSCRILRGGTELRWIRIRIVPVVGDDGEVDKLAGTVEDITVQKQSEQEARRHQDNLAHAQRLNTVGQMAAELAHEINQPLSAIVSFASGCQRRIRGGKVDEATLVTALDSISAQALRGAAIVKRLRGFVQREEPHLEGVDINNLVAESAGFIEAEVRGGRINVSFDLDPAIPAVLADSVQVEQVVLNLMRNGLDAIESQPRREGELIVRTARKGSDAVEVRVIDSGPGLGDADFEKIFDAFYTTKGGGLGMGLSISRSIIAAHGGRLWAESNSEAGMTFTFSLPAHIQRRDHGR